MISTGTIIKIGKQLYAVYYIILTSGICFIKLIVPVSNALITLEDAVLVAFTRDGSDGVAIGLFLYRFRVRLSVEW